MIGLIQNNTKVILDINRDLIEVYDIENDPNETISLDPKEYKDEILKLLLWHFCQKDYYKNARWLTDDAGRCSVNNNFKV